MTTPDTLEKNKCPKCQCSAITKRVMDFPEDDQEYICNRCGEAFMKKDTLDDAAEKYSLEILKELCPQTWKMPSGEPFPVDRSTTRQSCVRGYLAGHQHALESVAVKGLIKTLNTTLNYLHWNSDELSGDDMVGDGKLTKRYKEQLAEIESALATFRERTGK